MTNHDQKAIVRRFIDEVLAAGRLDAIDELVAPTFVSHTWGITEDGPARLRAVSQRVHAVLSEVAFEVEDVIAEDDRVAVRLTSSATPTDAFMGVDDAAGKRYTNGEMHWFRLAEGRIVEHWHQHDAMGIVTQLRGGSR